MQLRSLFMMFSLIATLGLNACGGTTGGTETGSTTGNIDTTTLADHITTTSNAVLLSVNDSDIDASLTPGSYLIDGTADEWSTYLDSDNSYVITDIFGDPEETPQVVTKIRVLLDQFSQKVEEIFSQDPDIDCTEATALSDSETLEVAFYGELDNGPAEDRYFDCVSVDETDNVTFVYGSDADGIIRLVEMKEITMENTEDVATRGDEMELHSVVSAVYAEQTESDETVAYLDVQYSQASIYNGEDLSADTTDDMMFKSRSRITGLAVLNGDTDVSSASGDFNVTKYDRSLTPEDVEYEIVTQTMGRGNYGDGGYSLFKVDSDIETLETLDGTFCIQSSETSLPAVADETNCTTLETAFAWGDTTFPFDLAPALDATFDDNAFFAGDDEDLIAEDGSNYTIPTY